MTGCAADEKEQSEEIAPRCCSVANPIVGQDAAVVTKPVFGACSRTVSNFAESVSPVGTDSAKFGHGPRRRSGRRHVVPLCRMSSSPTDLGQETSGCAKAGLRILPAARRLVYAGEGTRVFRADGHDERWIEHARVAQVASRRVPPGTHRKSHCARDGN